MAKSAGKVLLMPKGDYNPTDSYEILDWVRYNSKTWVCIDDCTGETPSTTSAYWKLFSVDGNGITNISKISSVGLVDTYRISYTDGNYFDFEVTNGAGGSGSGDGSTIKSNASGQLYVPIDNDTVYVDPADGLMKAKGGGGGVSGGSILHVHTRDFIGMTVTVTDSDPDTGEIETLTSTFDSTGLATFHVTGSGIAEVSVTDTDGKVYKSSVNMTYYGIYAVSVNRFSATINVTVESGANVTATDGTNTYSAVSNGIASISIGNVGSFTISATIDGVTSDDKKTVAISSDGETKSTSIEFAKISVDFTGTLIASVTNGTFTKPINSSIAPVLVYVPSLDTYQISGTLDGNQIDTSVIVNAYTTKSVTISVSSFYKDWLTLGGFSTTTYPTLADLLTEDSQGENEKAIRKLMTLHDCADKLIEWYNDNPSDFPLNEFVSSRIAMKWIGLRDYVCDKLMAIEDIYNAMMSSTHWEYILKDKVPTMTSNSAPYGEVLTGYYSDPWKAFDGKLTTHTEVTTEGTNAFITYKFPTPICVKKIKANMGNYATANKFVVSFEGSNTNTDSDWHEIGNVTVTGHARGDYEEYVIDSDNNDYYYLYYRLYLVDKKIPDTNVYVFTLQYYGRALNVSVPKMASNNTTPYGTAYANSEYNDSYRAWKAFDKDTSSLWGTTDGAKNSWISYDFGFNVLLKHVSILNRTEAGYSTTSCVIEGYNEDIGDWDTTTPIKTITNMTPSSQYGIDISTDKLYKKIRVRILTSGSAGQGFREINFYGVDYSEREFEPNTTMRYIYDNGVELEQVTKTATSVLANIDINTTDKLLRATVGSHATTSDNIKCGSGSATLTSDMMPNNCYLDISSISGMQEVGFSQVADTTDISCWVE